MSKHIYCQKCNASQYIMNFGPDSTQPEHEWQEDSKLCSYCGHRMAPAEPIKGHDTTSGGKMKEPTDNSVSAQIRSRK